MEQYIGHFITIIVFLVSGGIAWGMLKMQVSAIANAKQDHETRLRLVESGTAQWNQCMAAVADVTNQLRNIQSEMSAMRTELAHRDRADDRISDALSANSIVIGELAEKIVRVETLLERNGK